jgi:hypothetical protein
MPHSPSPFHHPRTIGPARAIAGLALAGCALSAAAETAGGPCALVDAARLRALAPDLTLPLAADAPGTLNPRDLPGLPVPLQLAQCTSAMARSGAVGFRLQVLTLPRELSAAEWAATGRALGHDTPLQARAPQCGTDDQPSRQGTTLHTASCGQTRGRHRVEISFEHEQAARLPAADAIRALLAQVLARL